MIAVESPPYTLRMGDCLTLLEDVADGSVDLVAADLPYGSTQCKWDKRIDTAALWAHLRRVLKPSGAAVFTADFRFASELYIGNPKWFRYDLIWEKAIAVGHLDSKRRPLRAHETMLFFSPKGRSTYLPQMTVGRPYATRTGSDKSPIYGKRNEVATVNLGTRYPRSVLRFRHHSRSASVHPTQKPDEMGDWIVRTYSVPGDVILDPTMGSGSFGVAAFKHGRRFLGFEADPKHFATAERRIGETLPA
jgi:DNA modification methylase